MDAPTPISLNYINQLENCRRKPTIDMLDKIANGINSNIDHSIDISSSDLIKYNPNFCRIIIRHRLKKYVMK